jgi:hypothetical protein
MDVGKHVALLAKLPLWSEAVDAGTGGVAHEQMLASMANLNNDASRLRKCKDSAAATHPSRRDAVAIVRARNGRYTGGWIAIRRWSDVQDKGSVIGDLWRGWHLKTHDVVRVRDQEVVRVSEGFVVTRSSRVGTANEVGEADPVETSEGFAFRKQVQVATQNCQVARSTDGFNERPETGGLGVSGRSVVLAGWVAQTVRVDNCDVSCCGSVYQAESLGDARTVANRPLLMINERTVDEPGHLSDHWQPVANEHPKAKILLVRSSALIEDRAGVTRDEEALVLRQELPDIIE